jgi:Doubled CXXCH motif (Paired_CXXCH_1)
VRCLVFALVTAGSLVLLATSAFAQSNAPHVTQGAAETDTCAMCHRAHTSASGDEWTDPFGTNHSSMLIGTSALTDGDVPLCLSCHGVDQLGSGIDVQTSFLSSSRHLIAPEDSAYGPTPKECSSCHDSHGSAKNLLGLPYPALLRSKSVTNADIVAYEGDRYCANCHLPRANNEFDGLSVWQQTAHAQKIQPTTSGTGIVCSVCHDPHGSNSAPSIVSEIAPPSVATTVTVPGNDRSLCYGCHPGAQATYPGGVAFNASGHGSSATTVPITWEWASRDLTETARDRRVGECQVCHDPMGRNDGSGKPVARLGLAQGRVLCYQCHGAASTVATDVASSVETPIGEEFRNELFVAWSPTVNGGTYDNIQVFTVDTTGTPPRPLVGPRQFKPTGRAGDAASGDINGNGALEVVVGDSAAPRVDVWRADPLQGVAKASYTLSEVPTFVGVGNVLLDGSGLPELVAVTRDGIAPYPSRLYVYRWNGSGFTTVLGPVAVGDNVSSLAVGDVTGTSGADVVVTNISANELRVLTEPSGTPGTLSVGGPYVTGAGPRGLSIGDAWDDGAGANEIVLANSGATTSNVAVYSGDGVLRQVADATATAGAIAYDTLVADCLSGNPRPEVVVDLYHATDKSAIEVFSQIGGILTSVDSKTDNSARTHKISLAAGDLTADGDVEIVAANAGEFTGTTAFNHVDPSIDIYKPTANGQKLNGVTRRQVGGAEMANDAPALVVADLGLVGKSRHPVDAAASASHVSTEVAGFTPHVDCSDCHNVHDSNATTTTAPAAGGAIKGTWGVTVENAPATFITYTEKQGVERQYELCMKCHSGWAPVPGRRNIASEMDTRNPSFHAVEGPTGVSIATPGSFVPATPAWSNDSVLYCTDCHDQSDATAAKGPHSSDYSSLLKKPYFGASSNNPDVLCYACHKATVYYDGSEDGVAASTSHFYEVTQAGQGDVAKKHSLHVLQLGLVCDTCHASHGSTTLPHLIRSDVGYTASENGGTCTNTCHGGASKTYGYFIIDLTAPTTTSDALASYTDSATITLTAIDNADGSGVASTHYVLDGGTEAVGSVVTVSTLGSHTLEFWSVDVAGNAETPHTSVGFTIKAADLIAPTTTSDTLASYADSATITFTATDNAGGEGVASTHYILDGGAEATGNSVTVNTAGTHTLEFWSVDVAGNVETPHQTVSFQITDSIAPTTASDAQPTYADSATITLTGTDNAGGSGIGSSHYILDGGTETTGTVVTVSTAGSHTLEFWSVDAAGNVETPHTTVSFQITDSIAPTTTSDAQASYAGTATITLTGTDNAGGSGVEATHYILDGGTEATGTVVTVSTVGSHTLEFWSVDVAGNAETPHQTVSFTVIDSIAPATMADVQFAYVDSATITLTAADNTGGSGVESTHYILDGGTEATGTVVTVSALGSHTLEFWSVDIAGNAETPHQTVSFTID